MPTSDPDFYEQIDHTADLGILVRGENPRALFGNAARALADLHTDLAGIEPRVARTIEVTGEDWENLLHNWLRELHYVYDTERLLLSHVEIREFEETRLTAECRGEVFDPDRHAVRCEIKAVTHHGLAIWENEDGSLEAEVIFDL